MSRGADVYPIVAAIYTSGFTKVHGHRRADARRSRTRLSHPGGVEQQQGWRERYPAKLDFRPQEIRGSGDLWIAEGLLSYDGGEPLHYVKIMQFRGDKVARETLYFADSFPAPEWRQEWAAKGPRPKRQHDLPEHVIGGNRAGPPH